jgi:hypothetical protein
MALKGEKKADYQRHYMRRYRAEGRDPRDNGLVRPLVRPDPISSKTLLDPSSKTQITGLVMDGNRIIGIESAPVAKVPQTYIPGQHYQPGDKVMVQRGRQTVEAIIPELDADGNPIPE